MAQFKTIGYDDCKTYLSHTNFIFNDVFRVGHGRILSIAKLVNFVRDMVNREGKIASRAGLITPPLGIVGLGVSRRDKLPSSEGIVNRLRHVVRQDRIASRARSRLIIPLVGIVRLGVGS